MINKSLRGQTKKYSDVIRNIKNKQPQQKEEPRITMQQVIDAFHSFGFEPNLRGHNDIGLWTTRGQSEGPKLMEELSKRRKEINAKEDEDKKREEQKKRAEEDFKNQHDESKRTIPRLSDEEIAALFDEYGLPAPDPEWARNHMPNDPKKIRSILEMQRKTADDLLKKHSKNAVNAVPEISKNQPMGGMGGYYGRGGPTSTPSPVEMQGDMAGENEPVTPFFVGDHALVKITNPNNPNAGTLWLVDKKKKVLRPILSEKALENTFEDPEEARNSIITLSSKALGPGGPLEGFTPLSGEKGLRDDGSMDDIEYSPSELQNKYGKPEDVAGENKALSILDGIFGKLNMQPQEQSQEQQIPQENNFQ